MLQVLVREALSCRSDECIEIEDGSLRMGTVFYISLAALPTSRRQYVLPS